MAQEHESVLEEGNKTSGHADREDAANSAVGAVAETILNALPVGVVTFGPDLKINHANPRASDLISLDTHIDKSLAKAACGPGSTMPNWSDELKSVLSNAKPRVFDNVKYTLNNQTRLLRISCIPSVKAGGTMGGAVIIEDVTKDADIQARLAEAEKFANLGRIASKVAHELNNPIDGILRYINLTSRAIERRNLEKPKHYLNQCRQALMRMVHVVGELLEFSTGSCQDLQEDPVGNIIEEALSLMEPQAQAANVRILRDYAPDVPKIRAGSLFQVFCNLVKNALDAMPNGGQLHVSTRITPENTLAVEVRDTGEGFEPENTEAMFEPFFTTKQNSRGTGLGLAVCKDIVERYRGKITAQNHPEQGSIFTVYLPLKKQTD